MNGCLRTGITTSVGTRPVAYARMNAIVPIGHGDCQTPLLDFDQEKGQGMSTECELIIQSREAWDDFEDEDYWEQMWGMDGNA